MNLRQQSWPEPLDVRVINLLTTTLFLVTEAETLAFAYTHAHQSTAPLSFFAYTLPVFATFPWLMGRKLSRSIERCAVVPDAATESRISMQVSMVVIVAYVLLGLTLGMADFLKVF